MAAKGTIRNLERLEQRSGRWTYRIPSRQPDWSVEECRAKYAELLVAAAIALQDFAEPVQADAWGLEKAEHPIHFEAAREPDGVLKMAKIVDALLRHTARIDSLEIYLGLRVWLPDYEYDLERTWIERGGRIYISKDEKGLMYVSLRFYYPVFAPWFLEIDNRQAAEANQPFLRHALATLDAAYGTEHKHFYGLEGVGPLGYTWE